MLGLWCDVVRTCLGFDLNVLATMVMQGGVSDTAINQGQVDNVMSLVADAKESIAMMS